MDKKHRGWRAFLPTRRRLIQVYAALLYNAHAKGFIEGDIYTGALKSACVPGLNCYSCPGAVGACPLGALQNALASSGTRAPFYVLGILLMFGLLLGRTICGCLCPVGLIQELMHKLPLPKLKKGAWSRVLSYLKYVILVVFVISIPLYYAFRNLPLPAFCKYICPAGTLEGAVGLLSNPVNSDKFPMLGLLFTRKFLIAALLLTASGFIYRVFCRFLCPLGAIYGLFSKVSMLGVTVEPTACIHCGKCVGMCKMDVCCVGDHECIHCGECMNVCPTGAIRWKGRKGKPSRVREILLWAAAIALLVALVAVINRPAPEVKIPDVIQAEVTLPDDTPVGSAVGDRCPDFAVPLLSGGTFSPRDGLGKTTILNFWATWCTPCVKELPYFEQILDTYGDSVSMAIIHSDLVTEDVQAYAEKSGYRLPFALDGDGSVIASLGGSTMLPMTVILDKNGHIVYNQVGSVSYALLESFVQP